MDTKERTVMEKLQETKRVLEISHKMIEIKSSIYHMQEKKSCKNKLLVPWKSTMSALQKIVACGEELSNKEQASNKFH